MRTLLLSLFLSVFLAQPAAGSFWIRTTAGTVTRCDQQPLHRVTMEITGDNYHIFGWRSNEPGKTCVWYGSRVAVTYHVFRGVLAVSPLPW